MLHKLMLTLTTKTEEYYMPTTYAATVIANAFIRKSINEDIPVNKGILAWLVAVANHNHKEKYGRYLISEQPEEINDEIVIPTLSYKYLGTPKTKPIEQFIYATKPSHPFEKRIAYFPPSNSYQVTDSINSAWHNFLTQLAASY